MSALTFGIRNRYRFMSAGPLDKWAPSGSEAIYAVTYKANALINPKKHTVVFFGETPDLVQQAESIRQGHQRWWTELGGIEGELFMFYHEMPGSSQYERMNVQKELIADYDPQGNS